MKYLFILLSVLVFTSCQKEQCWVCHVTVNLDSTSSQVAKEHFDVGVCGKTKKQINAYESDIVNSGRIEYDSNGMHHIYQADFKSVDCN